MGLHTKESSDVDRRINYILQTQVDKAHMRRKSKLFIDWSAFLRDYGKCPLTATPEDLLRFLVSRDKKGKTRVHVYTCPQIGLYPQTCDCPKRLRAKTVHGMVSSLNVQYEYLYGHGVYLPGKDHRVKMFVDGLFQEQAIGRVLPRQATPMFLDKLRPMLCHLKELSCMRSLKLSVRFNALRDNAFFSMQYFAGDRCSDLLNTLTKDIKVLPGVGLRISHFWGKVNRGTTPPTILTIPVVSELALCPVRALYRYVHGAASMNIDLSNGYLFRHSDQSGGVVAGPAGYDKMYYHLKKVMTDLGIQDGETPHSLRAGSTISLVATEATALEIMHHMGWKTQKMLEHYARTATCARSRLAARIAEPQVERAALQAKQDMSVSNLKHAF